MSSMVHYKGLFPWDSPFEIDGYHSERERLEPSRSA
jgi:hypothetical protein